MEIGEHGGKEICKESISLVCCDFFFLVKESLLFATVSGKITAGACGRQ